jgi:hypothetical protein
MGDNKVLKKLIGHRFLLAHYVYLIMVVVGIYVKKSSGGNKFLNASEYFPMKIESKPWNQLRITIRECTKEERDLLSKDIFKSLKDFAPLALMTKHGTEESVRKLIETLFEAENTKADKFKQYLRPLIHRDQMFSIVASELIRYRYYMDLDIEETNATSPHIPSSLGEKLCDSYVRTLIPQIPSLALNKVKEQMIMEEVIPAEAEKVVADIDKAIKDHS